MQIPGSGVKCYTEFSVSCENSPEVIGYSALILPGAVYGQGQASVGGQRHSFVLSHCRPTVCLGL